MKDNVAELNLLSQAVLGGLNAPDEKAIIKKFVEVSLKLLKADFGFTWYKPVGESAYRWVYKTPNTPYNPGVPRKNGVMAKSLRSKVPLFIENTPRSKEARDEARANMASVAVIPIIYKKNVYGNLVVCYKKHHKFTPQERVFCSYIGNNAAQAITINRLYANLAELKHTLDNARDAMFILEPEDLRILYTNQTAIKHLGMSEKQLVGKSVRELQTGIPLDSFQEIIQTVIDNPTERRLFETEISLPEQEVIPIEVSLEHVVKEKSAAEPRLLATVRNLTDQKNAESEIKRSIYYDKLTGLPNRKYLMEELPKVIELARQEKRQFAVIFGDLDKFKFINDMLGHEQGDLLLVEAAKRLWDVVEKRDMVARTGGNEFILLLEHMQSIQDIERVAERIQSAFSEAFLLEGQEIYMSISLGISVFPNDGTDVQALLRNGQAALRSVKSTGGGSFRHYYGDIASVSPDQLKLQQQLRQAIGKGQLVVYYQPAVSLANGKVLGAEAQLRWQHPDRGLLLPEEFLPKAEENGFIVEIGYWLIREVAGNSKAWQKKKLGSIPVSVNLSYRQLAQHNVVEDIAKILSAAGVPPHLLSIEVAESTVMKDLPLALSVLTKFKQLGCKILVDGFGRGYSSLKDLKQMPIDSIKIDPSFIEGIGSDKYDNAIVSAIISLAHDMKLLVVAEGVRENAQVKFLTAQGCDMVQGDWFTKALPANAFAPWVVELNTVRKT